MRRNRGGMDMTDKRRKILLITAIMAVAVIAFALLYSLPQGGAFLYRDSIRRAEEAYAKGDYDTAILRYKDAIEADETSVPAYEGLSNTYVATGQFEMARSTLWTGYQRTNSKKLYTLWFHFFDAHPEVLNMGGAQSDISADKDKDQDPSRTPGLDEIDAELPRISMTGEIIDAQTGDPVDGITLQFRAEGDQTGDVLAVGETGSDGSYETELPAGTYTVELGGSGYITEYRDIEIAEEETEAEEDFVLTKELSTGEARIVLEWGSSPSDLDSHLTGTTDSGRSIHVYYSDKSSSDGNGPIADLDLDDTDYYGPETTTIYNLNGTYEFYVHNFNPSTGTLEGSGATVKVYLPGQSVQTYHVSGGQINGDMWYVCTIDHGVLKSAGGSGGSSPDSTGDKPGGEGSSRNAPERITMESVGLPYGLYEGYKNNTGDGAIEASLLLNDDMTYHLECIFPLFGENYDSDRCTYTGTYRVDRVDGSGAAVLQFENNVQDFEMKQKDFGLDCEYFFVNYPADYED